MALYIRTTIRKVFQYEMKMKVHAHPTPMTCNARKLHKCKYIIPSDSIVGNNYSYKTYRHTFASPLQLTSAIQPPLLYA